MTKSDSASFFMEPPAELNKAGLGCDSSTAAIPNISGSS